MGKKTLEGVTNEKETASQSMEEEKAEGHVWHHAKEGRVLRNSAPPPRAFTQLRTKQTVFNVKFVIVYVILEANGKTSSFPKNHHPAAARSSHRGGGMGPLQVEQSSDCWCGEIEPTA